MLDVLAAVDSVAETADAFQLRLTSAVTAQDATIKEFLRDEFKTVLR